MTSAPVASMTEIAMFDGVPPNMSVSTTTPAPLSARADRLDQLLAALLDIVVRADRQGFELLLWSDDVLERRFELSRQPRVRDDDQTDHRF